MFGQNGKVRNEDGGETGEDQIKSEDITSVELQLLALVCLLCIHTAVTVMDGSITEASNSDG